MLAMASPRFYREIRDVWIASKLAPTEVCAPPRPVGAELARDGITAFLQGVRDVWIASKLGPYKAGDYSRIVTGMPTSNRPLPSFTRFWPNIVPSACLR